MKNQGKEDNFTAIYFFQKTVVKVGVCGINIFFEKIE